MTDPLYSNFSTPSTISDNSVLGHSDIFFAAVEKTRMPMVVTDPNQHDNPIIFCNHAFVEMIGYTYEEIIGNNCRFLQGKDSNPDTVKLISEAIRERRNLNTEILNYRKDGTYFWNVLYISPIFNKQGDLVYFFGSQLDVTRRKEAEEGLRKSQRLEAVGQLTGGLAHDFNNLLTIILGNIDIGRLNIDNPDRVQHYFNMIEDAATKGQKLTQHLLAFARRQQLESLPTKVDRLLMDLSDLLSKTLGSEVDIHMDLGEGIWTTRLDSVQFEMAILNILLNARDAMSGRGAIKVDVKNVTMDESRTNQFDGIGPGRYVTVQIQDNGIGMSPDVLAHSTEPFFTTKDVGKGTGLGLSQVYGYVRQSKGFIDIQSEENIGTTVTLGFPALKDGEWDGFMAPPQLSNEKGPMTLPDGKVILLVEDNADLLELAQSMLLAQGYKVICASSGQMALDILDEGHPIDLLFSDIAMPGGLNGIMLANKFKQARQHGKILLTTGFTEEYAGKDSKTEYDVIRKPYRMPELSRRIRDILNA